MSEIQTKAVKKAIGLLRAAGAEAKVIFNGEVVFDNLPAAPERKKYHRFQPTVNYTADFKPQLAALEEAETPHVTLTVPEHMDVARYRGAVAAWLTQKYGSGTCITSINREKRTVDVLLAR